MASITITNVWSEFYVCFLFEKMFQLFTYLTSVHLSPALCHAVNKYRGYSEECDGYGPCFPDAFIYFVEWGGLQIVLTAMNKIR